jgi:PIN domain nuclease of toxin-antitoxin system
VRLLLDTHEVLALLDDLYARIPRSHLEAIADPRNDVLISVASLWEIAIKARRGRLPLKIDLAFIPDQIRTAPGLSLLDISSRHVLADIDPKPSTNDPFDRLLLAVADVEAARLLTVDRELAGHPLAWKPTSA